jgi:alkylation response protein AidB-like acyl-CoA dehydrogenase
MTDASFQPGLLKPTLTAEQDDWLDRVDKLAPLIAEHRDRSEQDRVTSPLVFDALRDAGITRMWVSKEFGGDQVSLQTGVTVIEALARIDASVAWQMGVQGAVGRLSDYLSESVARRLFKDNTRLVVGGVRPTGSAEMVDGGYLLSGEWGFASGSSYAEWLICTAVVTVDGKPVMTPAGPEARVLFIPRSEAQMLDTWYTLGLRGTGSQHFRVEPTFVPEELAVSRTAMRQMPEQRPSRAYDMGYFDFVPFAECPTTLGVAQDALDSFKPLVSAKTPTSGTVTLAANHVVQEKLARAEMLVYSARLLLWDAARQATAFGETGGEALSSVVRLTTATVAEQTTAAVDILYNLAGSTSMYATSRLERCFRDIHSANKHISMSSTHFEMVGLYLVGGGLQWRR